MAFAEPQFELSEEDLDERTHVIAIAGKSQSTPTSSGGYGGYSGGY